MNYQSPQLRSRLASEYVLGTLRGRARKRFENLMRADYDLQNEVREWERRLSDLNDIVSPAKPPPRVWRKINARLFQENEPESIATRSRHGVDAIWRWIGLTASATTLALGLYVFAPILNPPEITGSDRYLSLLQDDDNKAAWSVQLDQQQGKIKVNAHTVPTIESSQDYQLWLLLPDDQPPVSLGLLPASGQADLPLAELPFSEASGIAVSLEPKGGSPTGAPTGPVLYVASLLSISGDS